MNDQPLPTDGNDFNELLQEAVVNKRCGNCGADTIMNARYARYVQGNLLSCGRCRNQIAK